MTEISKNVVRSKIAVVMVLVFLLQPGGTAHTPRSS